MWMAGTAVRQLLWPEGLAPFHDFESVVPQEVKDKLAEIDAEGLGLDRDRLQAVED